MIAAAKRSGCRSVGYEIDQRKVEQSKANVVKAGLQKLVSIRRRDIFELDLGKATVITMYLLPEMHEKLIPQLNEMRDGSRIVTHDFPIPGRRHQLAVEMTSKHDDAPHRVYLYRTPLSRSEPEAK